MMTRAFCRALAVIGWLSALAGAEAATITVANSNSSGYPAIGHGAHRIIAIWVVEVYAFVLTRTATEKL
jgi:hypothetical protein